MRTEWLKDLIDRTLAHAWISSSDGGIEYVNRQLLEYIGLPLNELQGDGWTKVIHPDDLGDIRQIWQEMQGTGVPKEAEGRVRHNDGSYRWYLFRPLPLLDEHGNIVNWYGLNVDIHDLKQAEKLLAGEKKLFEMVAGGKPIHETLLWLCQIVEEQAQNVMASVVLLDEDGKRLLRGSSPSIPIGWTEAVDGAVIGPCVGSCGTAAFTGKKVYVSDITLSPLWSEFRDLALSFNLRACWSSPVLSSTGKVLGTFAFFSRVVREISPLEERLIDQFTHLTSIVIERKRAEDSLRKSEDFLAEGQKISQTGSWRWNIATDKVIWSEEQCRLYGFRPEDVGGTYAGILGRMQPSEQDYLEQTVIDAVDGSRDFVNEYYYTRPDGQVRRFQSTGRAILDEKGVPIEYIGTTRDVTESRRVENELRQTEENLRKAQAELAHVARSTTMGQLAASIAHDVSQPLTGVAANANAGFRWLSAAPPNVPEALSAIQRVQRDSKRASEVITRVRMLFQKEEITKRPADLNEIIQEVALLIRRELTKGGVTLNLTLSAELQPVLVDRVQIQQVLVNLIFNGIDAMNAVEAAEKVIRISTRSVEDSIVFVQVQDAGTGVSSSDAEKIFAPFHTTKAGGVGMGLPICRSIIQDHGGTLLLVSHDGRGACFEFSLRTEV